MYSQLSLESWFVEWSVFTHGGTNIGLVTIVTNSVVLSGQMRSSHCHSGVSK